MKKTILLIDDETELRKLLKKLLVLEDYHVFEAGTGKEGIDILNHDEAGIAIVDVKLPDADGIELVKKIKELHPLMEIIVLTAYGTIEDGVRAVRNGAMDYIVKGDEENKILPLVANAFEKYLLKERLYKMENEKFSSHSFSFLTGKSEKFLAAKEIAVKVSGTDVPVLLLGETGTGKDMFARAIHYSGSRRKGPFVSVNSSAIARDLLESEMFGYKAGAFTGAVKNKKGLFEEAHSGTLFLDEIGELDISLQAKLLRVVETKEFIKPGDTKPITVDVRIIAATNRNLESEIKKENFRADLYYRLSVMQIYIPSLAERDEDIPELTEYFINTISRKLNKKIEEVSPDFLEKIQQYEFPGNIRELRNIIERAIILSENGVLSARLLPKEMLLLHRIEPTDTVTLADAEKNHIIKILEICGGNKSKAAKMLDIGIATLYRKMETYNLK